MRDLLDALLPEWEAGRTAALATVVRTFDSAPRPPGAGMVVTGADTVTGSVSGGCVEGAVYELGSGCIGDGIPVLARYGVSDDDAFAVGLTCGGTIDVFVEPVSRSTFPQLPAVAAAIRAGRPVGVATVIEHPDPARLGRHLVLSPEGTTGSLGSDRADEAVADDALGLLAAGRNGVLTYGPEGERLDAGMSVFFAAFAPAPRLLVFGAIDFASALARLGAFLGYRVTVCDARSVFATAARFPDAEEVIVAWPHDYYAGQIRDGLIDARTVVCVLTHDPKFDVPLLEAVLDGPAVAYIGAMGSRRTHEDRMQRLLESGVGSEQLALIHSPVGLDLGARTPEETAVSIAAEFISEAWGGSNIPLRLLDERIHHDEMPSLGDAPSPTHAARESSR
ncbi:XdhC family protein [Arthrobacter jiangjiafuii]|uniref:XdhC family protein n=1 Tax=Arthrobacter jiangjiafuii TaxID=2817475 RepID=A0A975M7S7_9MICC|nr:XdhC/CoxI family protein [Arthrobacter jiangjiafuii]MBP3044411.1 XdhC family protein [Arthrobacter jiangjiafuii]QWC11355.1 XdhC family protein [Arthrobacter jiangjiafuii]